MKERILLPYWKLSTLLLLSLASCLSVHGSSDCKNGQRQPDGGCTCDPCWKGPNCDQSARSAPKFGVSRAEVTLQDDHLDGGVLYRAVADEECDDSKDCPCPTLTYSILHQSPESAAVFSIDKKTGEVTMTGDIEELQSSDSSYKLELVASDEFGEKSTMDLIVLTKSGSHVQKREAEGFGEGFSADLFSDLTENEEPRLLHRSKRAVSLPGEVEFQLTKEGVNSADTQMKVGTKYEFKLQITMPDGDTTLKVELFAPDFDYTVMMLCDVAVAKGGRISISSDGSLTPVMEPQTNNPNQQYDRAVINLGTVSNSAGTTLEESMITVTYKAVMIDNSLTTNSEYWVSAGAEYANSENVWVGQASFTADTADDSASFTTPPDVSVTGPASLEIGDLGIYTVTAKIHAPYSPLKFNMFGGVNTTNALGACGARLESWGDGYTCGNPAVSTFQAVQSEEGDSVGYGRTQLDLGRPINSLARLWEVDNNNPEGEFTITVLARMYDNEDNVGNVYHLGFSFEIGTTTLWVGQTSITAVAHTTVSANPTFNVAYPGGQDVSQTSPVLIHLEMAIPDGSVGDYTLEVTTPLNNGALLQMCTVLVSSAGENIPCLDPTKEAVYSSTDPSGTDIYNNKAVFEIGKLSSAGSTWSSAGDANKITFSVAVKSTDNTNAGIGTSHTVSFNVIKDGTPLTGLPTATVTVVADSTATTITNDNVPVVNMTYGGDGLDTAVLGKTVKVIADIQTAASTVYLPFKFEAVMPNISGTPVAKICKVELHASGRNTPCMLDAVLQRKIQLMSSFDDGVLDRALLDLAGLCNLGLYSEEGDNNFALAISLALLDHPVLTSNPQQWISMGLAYSNSNLWVGQIAIDADLVSSIPALAQPPNLAIELNNGNLTSVPVGYVSKFLVRIKLRPSDFTVMTVNVSTTDDSLSICGVRLVRVGNAYPCLDMDRPIVIDDLDPVLGVNRKGSIDLGHLGNVGTDIFVVDSYYDENTVEVEVTAKLVSGTEGSTHALDVQLNYDEGHVTSLQAQGSVTATTTTVAWLDSATTPSDLNVGTSLTFASITGSETAVTDENLNTIVIGESKRLVFEYETERNMVSKLEVDVSTPDNDPKAMEVVYVGLLSKGANLPCLVQVGPTATYSKRVASRTFNDLSTLDLGYVCNTGTVNNTEADKLRVEAVVRLLPNAVVTVSETLVVTAALRANSQSSLAMTATLTVADHVTYKDFEKAGIVVDNATGIVFNSSLSAITMPVGSSMVLPLVFKVPPFTSSRVYLDAQMPVDTSAIMTITSFQVLRSGRSIGRLVDFMDSFTQTLTSAHNTTQNTKYDLDLGVITNTGVTQNEPDYSSDDDTFSAELTVQMADSAAAADGSSQTVSVGMHVAKFVFIMDLSITIDRTTHDLVFNQSSALDSFVSNTNHLEVDTILSLSDLSTAEGQNTTFNIFYPPYVSCQASITSDKKEVISEQRTHNSLSLGFGPLFFTDEVHIKTVLDADPGYEVPVGISGLDSVLLFQPMADKHGQTDIPGDFEYVNITVTTTTAAGTGCTPGDLGMEDLSIKDCQISASPDSITPATDGRYNVGTGWTPFVHYGAVRQERYFQVYFGDKVMVNKIKMQQTGTTRAQSVTVRYSNDGIAWVENPTNTMNPDTAQADQELSIQAPESSRYIRVMITDLSDNTQTTAFKFDFVGCVTLADGPADKCTGVVAATTPLADFKRRTFIMADTTLYVCDMIQDIMSIKQKCYSSLDHLSWTELDERVGSVIGFESEEPRVFGVSSDGLNYLSSSDGLVWMTSTPADITLAKAKITYKSATEVPLTDDATLNLGIPHANYQDMPYGATTTGLKHEDSGTWSLVYSWSQCCP